MFNSSMSNLTSHVIICDPNSHFKYGPVGLFLGQTMGSTRIESQPRDPTGALKKVQNSSIRDMQPEKRLDTDQTVFRVYKGVKTFDFCKEKNVIVTGGKILKGCGLFFVQ